MVRQRIGEIALAQSLSQRPRAASRDWDYIFSIANQTALVNGVTDIVANGAAIKKSRTGRGRCYREVQDVALQEMAVIRKPSTSAPGLSVADGARKLGQRNRRSA